MCQVVEIIIGNNITLQNSFTNLLHSEAAYHLHEPLFNGWTTTTGEEKV